MKNLAEKKPVRNGNMREVVEKARKIKDNTSFRKLSLAEHVLRKVETEMFLANNKNKDEDFAIMSNVCDSYSGWLNDDTLSWWFIDGSEIRWDLKTGLPELTVESDEVWARYLGE